MVLQEILNELKAAAPEIKFVLVFSWCPEYKKKDMRKSDLSEAPVSAGKLLLPI
jgi:hypothetical protein